MQLFEENSKVYLEIDEYFSLNTRFDQKQKCAQLARQLQSELNAFVEDLWKIKRNTEADIAAIKIEIQRLKDRLERAKLKNDTIRQFMADIMTAAKVKSVKTPLFTAYTRPGVLKVEQADPDALPDEFVKVETVKTPRKKEIIQHYKATGEVLPGCVILDDPDPILVIR